MLLSQWKLEAEFRKKNLPISFYLDCNFPALQVMPGWQRARHNWRRSAIAVNQVSLPPVVQPVLVAAPPQGGVLRRPHAAPAQGGARRRQPPVMAGSSVVGNIRVSRGRGEPALADPQLFVPSSEAAMSTPIGRSRRRSRSMTSPTALLEEYKTRWTCKVTISP